MDWLLGIAALPLLMCGLMCVGGIALAAVGLRRRDSRPGCHGTGSASAEDTESSTPVPR